LGRKDIGQIKVGYCADLALFDLRTLAFAGGAVHDPIGSLMLCASPQSAHTVVNGQLVVKDYQLTTVELGPLIEKHNALAVELVQKST
jgi:8-oxoguanine deaminase